jgi:hypothetical protein
MDIKSIKKHLEEVTAELARVEAERKVLISLKSSDEALLQLYNVKPQIGQRNTTVQVQIVTPNKVVRPDEESTDNTPSARGTVLRVMRESGGVPLSTGEILTRVRDLGAKVREDDPERMIDLMGYSLRKSHHPIEKVGPRLWQWVDTKDERIPLFEVKQEEE